MGEVNKYPQKPPTPPVEKITIGEGGETFFEIQIDYDELAIDMVALDKSVALWLECTNENMVIGDLIEALAEARSLLGIHKENLAKANVI